MARRKKKEDSGNWLVLALKLVGAAIVLFSFLAILLLVGAWLYFEKAIRRYDGITGRNDFELAADDLRTLEESLQAKVRIDSRLAEIRELRRTLPLKGDGSFDGRNREGKSLNAELQMLRAELEQCDRTIDDLSSREENDFRRWVTLKSGLYASRGAMLAFPIIALALFSKPPTAVSSLSTFIERQTGLASVANIDALYGVLACTAGMATVVFLLTWGIGRLIALQSDSE